MPHFPIIKVLTHLPHDNCLIEYYIDPVITFCSVTNCILLVLCFLSSRDSTIYILIANKRKSRICHKTEFIYIS